MVRMRRALPVDSIDSGRSLARWKEPGVIPAPPLVDENLAFPVPSRGKQRYKATRRGQRGLQISPRNITIISLHCLPSTRSLYQASYNRKDYIKHSSRPSIGYRSSKMGNPELSVIEQRVDEFCDAVYVFPSFPCVSAPAKSCAFKVKPSTDTFEPLSEPSPQVERYP